MVTTTGHALGAALARYFALSLSGGVSCKLLRIGVIMLMLMLMLMRNATPPEQTA